MMEMSDEGVGGGFARLVEHFAKQSPPLPPAWRFYRDESVQKLAATLSENLVKGRWDELGEYRLERHLMRIDGGGVWEVQDWLLNAGFVVKTPDGFSAIENNPWRDDDGGSCISIPDDKDWLWPEPEEQLEDGTVIGRDKWWHHHQWETDSFNMIWNLFFGSRKHIITESSDPEIEIPRWAPSELFCGPRRDEEVEEAPSTMFFSDCVEDGDPTQKQSLSNYVINTYLEGLGTSWHLLNDETMAKKPFSIPKDVIDQYIQTIEEDEADEYWHEGEGGWFPRNGVFQRKIAAIGISVPLPPTSKRNLSPFRVANSRLHVVTSPMGTGKSQFLRLFSSQLWKWISKGDGGFDGNAIDSRIKFDYLAEVALTFDDEHLRGLPHDEIPTSGGYPPVRREDLPEGIHTKHVVESERKWRFPFSIVPLLINYSTLIDNHVAKHKNVRWQDVTYDDLISLCVESSEEMKSLSNVKSLSIFQRLREEAPLFVLIDSLDERPVAIDRFLLRLSEAIKSPECNIAAGLVCARPTPFNIPTWHSTTTQGGVRISGDAEWWIEDDGRFHINKPTQDSMGYLRLMRPRLKPHLQHHFSDDKCHELIRKFGKEMEIKYPHSYFSLWSLSRFLGHVNNLDEDDELEDWPLKQFRDSQDPTNQIRAALKRWWSMRRNAGEFDHVNDPTGDAWLEKATSLALEACYLWWVNNESMTGKHSLVIRSKVVESLTPTGSTVFPAEPLIFDQWKTHDSSGCSHDIRHHKRFCEPIIQTVMQETSFLEGTKKIWRLAAKAHALDYQSNGLEWDDISSMGPEPFAPVWFLIGYHHLFKDVGMSTATRDKLSARIERLEQESFGELDQEQRRKELIKMMGAKDGTIFLGLIFLLNSNQEQTLAAWGAIIGAALPIKRIGWRKYGGGRYGLRFKGKLAREFEELESLYQSNPHLCFTSPNQNLMQFLLPRGYGMRGRWRHRLRRLLGRFANIIAEPVTPMSISAALALRMKRPTHELIQMFDALPATMIQERAYGWASYCIFNEGAESGHLFPLANAIVPQREWLNINVKRLNPQRMNDLLGYSDTDEGNALFDRDQQSMRERFELGAAPPHQLHPFSFHIGREGVSDIDIVDIYELVKSVKSNESDGMTLHTFLGYLFDNLFNYYLIGYLEREPIRGFTRTSGSWDGGVSEEVRISPRLVPTQQRFQDLMRYEKKGDTWGVVCRGFIRILYHIARGEDIDHMTRREITIEMGGVPEGSTKDRGSESGGITPDIQSWITLVSRLVDKDTNIAEVKKLIQDLDLPYISSTLNQHPDSLAGALEMMYESKSYRDKMLDIQSMTVKIQTALEETRTEITEVNEAVIATIDSITSKTEEE